MADRQNPAISPTCIYLTEGTRSGERESPTGQYREDSMCQAHNPTEQISAKSPRGLRQLPFGLWFFLSRKLLLTFKLHHYQLEGSQCSELEKQEMGICREGDRGVEEGGHRACYHQSGALRRALVAVWESCWSIHALYLSAHVVDIF